MDVRYCKADLPQDLDELIQFDRQVFGRYPADIFDSDDWNNLETYWMVMDGKRVGCSAFLADVDFDEQARPGCLLIASTGILPDYQDRRLGTTLTLWQIEYARLHGFTVIVTNTRETNVRMFRIYQKLGFSIRCLIKHYYDDPDESAVVMELPMTEQSRLNPK